MRVVPDRIYPLAMVVLVFAVIFGINAFWLYRVDLTQEMWSQISIAYNNYDSPRWKGYDAGRIWTGEEARKYTLGDTPVAKWSPVNISGHSSLVNALADIWVMRKSPSDFMHTPLFYSLLRLALIGDETPTIEYTLGRFRALMLFLLSAGVLVFFLFIRRLFPAEPLVWCVALLGAFASPVTIRMLVEYRMYPLMFLLFTWFLYYMIPYWRENESSYGGGGRYTVFNGRAFINPAYFAGGMFLASLVLWSHFMAIVFVALFAASRFILCLYKKDYIGARIEFALYFCAFMFLAVLYPDYHIQLISVIRAFSIGANSWLGTPLNNYVAPTGLATWFVGGFFTIPVISAFVFTSVCLFVTKNKISRRLPQIARSFGFFLGFVILFYACVIKSIVHIKCVIPFLSLGAAYMIFLMPGKKLRYICTVAFCAAFLAYPLIADNIEITPGSPYRPPLKAEILAKDFRWTNEPDLPVMFICEYSTAVAIPAAIYSNDNQKYFFELNDEALRAWHDGPLYLAILSFQGLVPDVNLSGFFIENTWEIGNIGTGMKLRPVTND